MAVASGGASEHPARGAHHRFLLRRPGDRPLLTGRRERPSPPMVAGDEVKKQIPIHGAIESILHPFDELRYRRASRAGIHPGFPRSPEQPPPSPGPRAVGPITLRQAGRRSTLLGGGKATTQQSLKPQIRLASIREALPPSVLCEPPSGR